jgi:hypothetical protein
VADTSIVVGAVAASANVPLLNKAAATDKCKRDFFNMTGLLSKVLPVSGSDPAVSVRCRTDLIEGAQDTEIRPRKSTGWTSQGTQSEYRIHPGECFCHALDQSGISARTLPIHESGVLDHYLPH